jgi:hypothetical protein
MEITDLLQSFTEVTAEQNESALCCLPPIYFKAINGHTINGFAVAEPFTHCADGYPVFSCYAEHEDKFYTFHAVLKKQSGLPIGDYYNNEEFTYDNTAHTDFVTRKHL